MQKEYSSSSPDGHDVDQKLMTIVDPGKRIVLYNDKDLIGEDHGIQILENDTGTIVGEESNIVDQGDVVTGEKYGDKMTVLPHSAEGIIEQTRLVDVQIEVSKDLDPMLSKPQSSKSVTRWTKMNRPSYIGTDVRKMPSLGKRKSGADKAGISNKVKKRVDVNSQFGFVVKDYDGFCPAVAAGVQPCGEY